MKKMTIDKVEIFRHLKLNKALLIRNMFPIILFMFSYCGKETSTDLLKGSALIKVDISGTEFKTLDNIDLKASGSTRIFSQNTTRISHTTFNQDFDLITEVALASSDEGRVQKTATNKFKAASQTNDLSQNIKYKLIVYAQDGSYVTERDYTRGQESSTAALNLNGGSTYTFVAYSINSTSVIPAITFTDSSNKTLANSFLQIDGNNDLMYFKKDMQVSGAQENYLGIILKHQLCQITTIIDATQTAYNITAITASYTPHVNNLTFSLSDGTNLSGSGTSGNANIVFPTTIDAMTVTANPTIINSNSTAGRLTIGSITVGPLSATNLVPFNNLLFDPGVKYQVKFTLVPKDIYLVHEGFSAVRLNGQIWLRHNLGATGDPDLLGESIAGGYYQFGRAASIASGTATSTNSNWNGTMAAANAWNTGTEAAPVKTSNDPCPSGYRVPTEAEFRFLINNTVSSQTGPWSSSRYASALIMTSMRNKNVKMTIPAQGYFNYAGTANPPFTPAGLTSAGNFTALWSSKGSGGANYFRSYLSNRTAHFVNTTDNRNKEWGFNVRCIATQL